MEKHSTFETKRFQEFVELMGKLEVLEFLGLLRVMGGLRDLEFEEKASTGETTEDNEKSPLGKFVVSADPEKLIMEAMDLFLKRPARHQKTILKQLRLTTKGRGYNNGTTTKD